MNMKDKIFIALSTFSEYGEAPLTMIKDSGIDYDLNPLKRRLVKKEILEMCRDATGIVAGVEPYDSSVLCDLPNLKCISRAGVGVDNIDLDYAEKNNITIRNTPDVVIRPVVELTLAMIFDLLRKTTFHTILLKSRRWEKSAGNLLFGKTVAIIGTGRIGKVVAELLIKLGAKINAYDVSPDKEWADLNSVQYLPFKQLLSSADIISLHATPASNQFPLIGKEEIVLMKQDVVLINTSRGECIDENALLDGLKSGKVGGVGMDVFPEEPYNGKLLDFDNVVFTPHLATLTKESRLEMEIQATQNLLDELNKQK
jgi:D-3-phosphoglycerate dehydrogenase